MRMAKLQIPPQTGPIYYILDPRGPGAGELRGRPGFSCSGAGELRTVR
jgi:hypothetical protein